MNPLSPSRMQAVQSPIIPVVAEWIRNCPGTISLGQGVVSYGPPPEAIEQIQVFLSEPQNHKYQSVQGIPPLLEGISEKLQAENRIPIGSGSSILVTAGGNLAFANAILAIADPGDEIILQTPYYFNHDMAVTLAGCKPVLVSTDEHYQLRPEAIRRALTPKTRAIVTVSPNNPTGAVYPEDSLREINALCREHGIYHISDEAYEYFTYAGARHFSPGAIPGSETRTISLFSLSKAYGFASWRMGYMVIPDHLLVSIKKIQDTLLICPPVISQYAALGALKAGLDFCRSKLKAIAEIREIALEELGQLGDLASVPTAKGAFYFLLKLNSDRDPLHLAEELIRKHGVAVIPGAAFGVEGCYLRVAYGALKKETAAAGLQRLVRGLRSSLSSI